MHNNKELFDWINNNFHYPIKLIAIHLQLKKSMFLQKNGYPVSMRISGIDDGLNFTKHTESLHSFKAVAVQVDAFRKF